MSQLPLRIGYPPMQSVSQCDQDLLIIRDLAHLASIYPDAHSVSVHLLYDLSQLTSLVQETYISTVNSVLLYWQQKLSSQDAGSR